jgi:hypothetical protein
MPKIRYIGDKPFKTDNVALTGVSWNGHGDVQDVPAPAVAKLLQHSNVWELVEEEPTESDDPVATLEGLRETARGLGLTVVPQWREKTLQREINNALAARQAA